MVVELLSDSVEFSDGKPDNRIHRGISLCVNINVHATATIWRGERYLGTPLSGITGVRAGSWGGGGMSFACAMETVFGESYARVAKLRAEIRMLGELCMVRGKPRQVQ